MSASPGWISTSCIVSNEQRHLVVYSQWPAFVRAVQSHPQMRACLPQIAALASFNSIGADVAYSRQAD